jgi:hydrogenase nickel incorporation protein HypA/HybF
MHELALMDGVVSAISDQFPERQVTRIRLEVGLLTAVVPEALRFCFDVCVQDTSLAGAVLDIEQVPGEGSCRNCGQSLLMRTILAQCVCGSFDFEIRSGTELRIKEIEVV